MIPPTEWIVQKRHGKRRQLRMIGVIMLLVAAVLLLSSCLSHLISPDLGMVDFLRNPEHSFSLALIPLSFILIWLDRSLVRMLVPMPVAECPRCNHAVTRSEAGICSECGLLLPEGLADRNPEIS